MASSAWDFVYSILAKRGRLFLRSIVNAVATYVEQINPVVLTTTVVTDSNGSLTLDYTGMNFGQVFDVQITPIIPVAGLANAVVVMLVGAPTLKQLNIQVYKPALAVLGAISMAPASNVTLLICVRGTLASA